MLCGTKDMFSVVGGGTGIFWYDRVNNYFMKYSDQIETISLSKGMQSFLNDDQPSDGSKVIGMADKNCNEILFTYSDGWTLAYSENLDTFISLYTEYPNIYIQYKNRYLTTDVNRLNYLFLHDANTVARCVFYQGPEDDALYYPSKLTLLINQQPLETKVFDNISYISSVYYNENTELYDQSINQIRCYTEYQNSDYIDLVYGDNLMRRERSWAFSVPRNAMTTNMTSNPNRVYDTMDQDRLFRERLRDKSMTVDFIYNNGTGIRDKFVLDNVSCRYRISAR